MYIKNTISFFVLLFILILTISCQLQPSGDIGYKPPFTPVRFLIDINGNISVESEASIVTPIGQFSIEGSLSLEESDDSLLLIIRDMNKPLQYADNVYRIATNDAKIVVVVDGRTTLDVTKQRIIVDISNSEIRTIDIVGDVNLLTTPQSALSASREIVFVSSRDGNTEIYAMNADGSDQIRLTKSQGGNGWPDWSPDGKRIAFHRYEEGKSQVLLAINADGTGLTQITNEWGGAPNWSPDARQLAFTCIPSGRKGSSADREVCVVDVDGSTIRYLTDNLMADGEPNWSPDRSHIAFYSKRDGNIEIYVMNADGSEQINLTNHPAADFPPAWSPDGGLIAFASERDGNSEIYVINADGSNLTRLTSNPAQDIDPTWSPDGKQIAFSSDRGGKYHIYVMNADGSSQVQLTNTSGDDWQPDWRR